MQTKKAIPDRGGFFADKVVLFEKSNINIRHSRESRYPEFGISGIGLSELLLLCLYMKIYS